MKYYFDTSSLAKIYHREQSTDVVINLYKSHDEIIISELAKIELISTIHRKYREHEISNEEINILFVKRSHLLIISTLINHVIENFEELCETTYQQHEPCIIRRHNQHDVMH